MTTIKKLIVAIACIALFTVYIFYNRSQDPTEEDVRKILRDWSINSVEVYDVLQRDGEWLAFFRTEQSIMVSRLEQNWLGTWKMINLSGEEGVLASISMRISPDDGVGWSASSTEEKSILFLYVVDPNVDKIVIEANGKPYNDVPFIQVSQHRFVVMEIEGRATPFYYQAFSKEGELIAPIPPKN